VYGLCCELYVFLFTLAMSSISANLLVSLSRRAMTAAEIEQLYDSRAMVSSRIDRLVAVGLFDETPAGLELTAKGARTVRTFGRLRTFFRHPSPVDLQ
jgi:predicted transcriptional regulator